MDSSPLPPAGMPCFDSLRQGTQGMGQLVIYWNKNIHWIDASKQRIYFIISVIAWRRKRKVKTSIFKIHYLLRSNMLLKSSCRNWGRVLQRETVIYSDKRIEQPQSRGSDVGLCGSHGKEFVCFFNNGFKKVWKYYAVF